MICNVLLFYKLKTTEKQFGSSFVFLYNSLHFQGDTLNIMFVETKGTKDTSASMIASVEQFAREERNDERKL